MKSTVYYFSGTGNTLRLAQEVAAGLRAVLRPIAAYRDTDAVEPDAEQVGIVFPVYYSDAPVVVREFIGKLQNLRDKSVFAVCTHGGAAGDALRTVRRLVDKNGGRLSLAFGVPMPQNSFYKWYENPGRRQKMLKKRCARIVKKIRRGAAGIRYHNVLLEWLMIPATKYLIKPACRRYFSQQSGLPADTPEADRIRNMDRGFRVLSACMGCGTCARVCPVHNIVIRNGRPEWLHRCENCLACYNWCPQKAITGGITKKGYFYRHPEAKLEDYLQT
jgi:ferredoxin